VDEQQTKQIVRSQLRKMLPTSGLLESSCPTPGCHTQIFTTWAVELTCERCGQKVRSVYTF